MNNLKDTEKCMLLSSRISNPEYELAYECMHDVFFYKDLKDKSNHCKILKLLYGAEKRKYTYTRIAGLTGTSDNALRRYRKQYAGWFNYYLNINMRRKNAG